MIYVSDNDNFATFASLPGNSYPPTEERAGPEGAEEEPPRVIASTASTAMQVSNSSNQQSGDEEDAEDEDEENCKSLLSIIHYRYNQKEYTFKVLLFYGGMSYLNFRRYHACSL